MVYSCAGGRIAPLPICLRCFYPSSRQYFDSMTGGLQARHLKEQGFQKELISDKDSDVQ